MGLSPCPVSIPSAGDDRSRSGARRRHMDILRGLVTARPGIPEYLKWRGRAAAVTGDTVPARLCRRLAELGAGDPTVDDVWLYLARRNSPTWRAIFAVVVLSDEIEGLRARCGLDFWVLGIAAARRDAADEHADICADLERVILAVQPTHHDELLAIVAEEAPAWAADIRARLRARSPGVGATR